jgi:DNA-binding beta-propeller fold protein YncE
LFVGCAEGKAVVLDVDHGGKIAGTEPVPSGVDIVSVNPQLRHFYVPSASDGSVTVLGVASSGALQRLGTFRATKGTHCAASDDHGRVWVCAPDEGSVMVFDDTFPASGG